MYPVIPLGPLRLEARPLLLLAALWAFLEIGAREARRRGLDGDHVYNAGLYGLVSGALAGRVAHVFVYWPAYRSDPLQILSLNPNALVAPVVMMVALAVIAAYLWHHRLPVARLADALAPAFLVGLALMSIADLLSGRAYGLPSDLPWAIPLWGARRHPTQVYQLSATLIVLVLVWRARDRARPAGSLALWGLLGISASWLFVEAFRADSALLPGGFRAGQVVALGGVLLALGLLWWLHARPASDGESEGDA